MNKKLVSTGLVAGLLAGSGAGLILQMSGSAGASGASGASIAAVAAEDDATGTPAAGADDATREADRTARLTEVLQPLVTDGTLTQAQLDKVIATLGEAGPMGDQGGRGGRGGPGLAVVAETLGMIEAEVRDAISGGQTLAQLAEAKGSTAQAVIDAMLAEVKAHLDEEVAAGDHTQEDADAKLAEATTRITELVNSTAPVGPMGGGEMGGRGPGGRGPGGHHGDRDGAPATDGPGTGSIDGGPADTDTTTG